VIEELQRKLHAFRHRKATERMSTDKALSELQTLKEHSTTYYRSRAGRAQLAWLDQYEANLLNNAITANDPTARLSSLDQAKGLQAFRAYLETLTVKD
jgi:hypothetical protein